MTPREEETSLVLSKLSGQWKHSLVSLPKLHRWKSLAIIMFVHIWAQNLSEDKLLKKEKKNKTWVRDLVTSLGRDIHWCAITARMVVVKTLGSCPAMRRGKELPGQSLQVQTASSFCPRQTGRCRHFLWVSWHGYRKWEALERYPLEI